MSTRLRILSLAERNLRRKPVRNVLLLLAIVVVTGTLFSATLFISSMRNALRIGTYRLGADVIVVPNDSVQEAKSALISGQPASFFMNSSVLDEVRKTEGVLAASPQLFIKPTTFSCCFNVSVFLVAFDPATDFTITPWLAKGLAGSLKAGQVLTGRNVPVITGDTIPFFGTPFTVAGTMEPTGMDYFDKTVFMTMDSAYKMAEDSRTKAIQPLKLEKNQISTVLVKVKQGYSPDRVALKINYAAGSLGVKAIASDQVITTVRNQLDGLLKGIVGVSFVLWIMALLMIGFAFYMIVNERQRELGLLKAMGARKSHVFRLIVTEAVILSTSGGVLGIGLGFVLLTSFKDVLLHSMKLPYLLPSWPVLAELMAAAIVFSHVTGIIASLLPAYIASRMDVFEAIRKGE